jgi:hypothetical protein
VLSLLGDPRGDSFASVAAGACFDELFVEVCDLEC